MEITVKYVKADLGGKHWDDPRTKWWKLDKNDLHKACWSVVETIETNQKSRWTNVLVFASMYENQTLNSCLPRLVGIRSTSGDVQRTEAIGQGQKATFNVLRSAIDAAHAKLTRNRPRVKHATSNASWRTQQRARRLTQFTDAAFRVSGLYDEGAESWRDAEVMGLGPCLLRKDVDKVVAERVFPLELTVDDEDGFDGHPRQMHRRKERDRDWLLARYPEAADCIREAPRVGIPESCSDKVMTIESWHLRSSPKSDDGCHTLCINNCCLECEPWEYDYFPIVEWRWSRKLAGFWGTALAEEIAPGQVKLNRLERQIDAAQIIMCTPHCWIQKGSQVSPHKAFDFGVQEYKGSPPQFGTPSAMPPEVYRERDQVRMSIYEIAGISQMEAQAQKPAGLDSRPALREFSDQTAGRFAAQGKKWEDGFVFAARVMLDMYREMHKSNPNIALLAISKRQSRMIKLSEVLLDETEFVRSSFPVSQLPNTPEGRLQYVTELAQAGYVDRETALEILQLGDTEDAISLLNADYDDAMFVIDSILEDGQYVAPEKYWNLQLTMRLAQRSLLRAQSQDGEETMADRLDMLRVLIDDIQRLIAEATPPPAPVAPVMPGAAMANAVPPPTSELLPVAA